MTSLMSRLAKRIVSGPVIICHQVSPDRRFFLNHVPEMGDEDAEEDHGAEAVQDAHRSEAAENEGEALSPAHVGELERHAGQRQGEEAHHHEDVQGAIEAVESPVERLVVGLCERLVRLPFVAAQPESDQPGQGVEQREGQRPDQQARHAPERPEEPGVLLGIVVRGVGQIAGELSCASRSDRYRMCRRRCPGRAANPGFVDGQNVVGPVAVVALGCACRPEARDLAVEGVEERLGLGFVAATALVHHHEAEVRFVGPTDRV